MPLTKKADCIRWLVDDHRKQAGDIAAENADVERFQLRHGRKLTAQQNLAATVTRKSNRRVD